MPSEEYHVRLGPVDYVSCVWFGPGMLCSLDEHRALVPVGPVTGWWPPVRMSDGTVRKGPYAEIVGRWSDAR